MDSYLTINELATMLRKVYSFWNNELDSLMKRPSSHEMDSIKHDYDAIFKTLRSGRYRFTEILAEDGNTLVHVAQSDPYFCRLSQFILENADRLDVPNYSGWLPHQTASKVDAVLQLKFMVEVRGINPFQTTWLQHAHSLAIAGQCRSPKCFEYLADKYRVNHRVLELWRPKETTTPFAKMFLEKFTPMKFARP